MSNTKWSVSSDIQSLRSTTSNTRSILSYIQTPTSHITNARVFKVNLANIQTAQEIIVISNSGGNVPADMQQPPPPPLKMRAEINESF